MIKNSNNRTVFSIAVRLTTKQTILSHIITIIGTNKINKIKNNIMKRLNHKTKINMCFQTNIGIKGE